MVETTLVPLDLRSQIDVRARGDAASRVASYLAVPALPAANRFVATRAGDCYWLGPDEWLVVGPESSRAAIQEALESALGPDEGAAVDVSSSRVLLELRGAAARDVLASCCALDLHPRVFGSGQCAQTLVAKAPVLLAQIDDTPAYWIFVRPSLASYVVSWLADGIEGLRARSERRRAGRGVVRPPLSASVRVLVRRRPETPGLARENRQARGRAAFYIDRAVGIP